MKTKLFVLVIFVLVCFVRAQSDRLQSDKSESVITYELTHPLHEVEATSKSSDCIIEVDKNAKQIKAVLVDVGVTTFNSGNSNRDSHAMEVIDAITYPDAKFLSSSITQTGDSLKIEGQMTFHGITKNIELDAIQKWLGNKLEVDGKFDLSLTAFKVERPTLLFMPVNDLLKFKFKEVFDL